MKLRTKLVFAAMVVVVAVVMMLFWPNGRCVSESLRGKSLLKDADREVCIAMSSGNDLEYWIDGERSTAGCHWHLEHIKCQKDECLYRCRETEAFWRLSKDGKAVKMKKDVKGATLPLEYHFADAQSRK